MEKDIDAQPLRTDGKHQAPSQAKSSSVPRSSLHTKHPYTHIYHFVGAAWSARMFGHGLCELMGKKGKDSGKASKDSSVFSQALGLFLNCMYHSHVPKESCSGRECSSSIRQFLCPAERSEDKSASGTTASLWSQPWRCILLTLCFLGKKE